MKNLCYINSPVGSLGIIEDKRKIAGIFFKNGKKAPKPGADLIMGETPLIRKTAAQLEEYFNGKRKTFDVPLFLEGSVFQLNIWKVLQKIPYGETRSYKEVASMAGNAKACRAAGMANNRNPIAIVVPCHRVIGADGSLTGYGGGLEKKRYLLELEGSIGISKN